MVVCEKARSVRQVCFLNKRPPSLLANRYLISQPLLSQPQLLISMRLRWRVLSILLHWHLLQLIPQNQIVAVSVPRSGWKGGRKCRASQPWDEALNLSGESREKAVPVSTSADRSLCEPQATAEPEPWGTHAWVSSRKNGRRDRSVHRGSTSQCSRALSADLFPNRQHKECVYPHPLDNVGREESTF